ncbi:glycine cleavage system protein H [Pseudonocardia oceani]|uniref:glycine cleavage system protein H n=1 Tax=Pseudonocardia oceani TaxID=2792013 RepID=UPI001CF70698|nr:glycine cleavage system protein H [Pseudonocardia oceani]
MRIGLSAQAVEVLGEIVHLELPEPGAELTVGDSCGEVESTESVSDLLSPVTGPVTAVNPALAEDFSTVNRDPHGEGWLFTANVTALGDVLTAGEYRAASADV